MNGDYIRALSNRITDLRQQIEKLKSVERTPTHLLTDRLDALDTSVEELTESLDDLTVGLADLQTSLVVEAWIAPTLLNSWVNFGAPYNPAGYYKDPFGRVYLRGAIKTGVSATIAFVLPAGYRPENDTFMASHANGALARIRVYANGDVTIVAGSATQTLLDNLSFRAV